MVVAEYAFTHPAPKERQPTREDMMKPSARKMHRILLPCLILLPAIAYGNNPYGVMPGGEFSHDSDIASGSTEKLVLRIGAEHKRFDQNDLTVTSVLCLHK